MNSIFTSIGKYGANVVLDTTVKELKEAGIALDDERLKEIFDKNGPHKGTTIDDNKQFISIVNHMEANYYAIKLKEDVSVQATCSDIWENCSKYTGDSAKDRENEVKIKNLMEKMVPEVIPMVNALKERFNGELENFKAEMKELEAEEFCNCAGEVNERER